MQRRSSPIRVVREQKNLTQVDLVRLSALSLSTIRNAEAGIATRATLTAIARALAVDVDVLTGRRAP